MRAGRVEVDSIGSPVIEAGPQGEREAVVFVHGNPGSRTDWTALVSEVGALGRAVALDMPGFGQADKPRRLPYEVPAYARFLQGAMAQLGIERAHLVLHDFGGPFGLMWGLEHPDSWASVVLINVGVLPGYRWHTMARRWRTPVLGELMNAWIPLWAWRRAMQRQNPKGLPPEFVDKMHRDFDRGTRRAVLALYRATDDPAKLASELGPQIAALRKPALVVWGDEDPYASAQYAERQREFFDVEDVVIVPGSGHWPFIDDPEPVEQAVVSFLRPRLQPQPDGG